MTEYFAPPGRRILAHRGLALDATENTLGAFRAALEAGATHLETDVHATADGVPVLWHDPTLRRFDGTDTPVTRSTWVFLRRRSSERGDALTTLAEALDAFPEARFNIDVKVPAAAEPVARAVIAAGAQDRVLLTSFRESTARIAWRAVPDAARSATGERVAAAVLGAALRRRGLVRRALSGIDALQIPERSSGLHLTSPRRLAAWRPHVREIHVWTVNDPTDMVRLWRAGIDGIVTDRADLATRARASLTTDAPRRASGNTDTVFTG